MSKEKMKSKSAPVGKKKPVAEVAAPAKKKPVAEVAAPAKKKGFPAKKSGAAKTKSKKKPLATYKAPADFKPHFLLVQIGTEKDGLLGGNVKATRYQGKFDREAADKKKSDLGSYDLKTLIGIQARLASVTYKANADKKYPANPKDRVDLKGSMRLPASTVFQVLMRIGKKAADQSVTAGIKGVFQAVENPKTGRMGLKELDKKDPCYRALRKSSRIMPAAFKEVLMPPKRTRGKVEEE
jgi:hypothetical protein